MADEGQRVARGTAGRVVEDRDVVHGQHCRLRAWCESAAGRAARVVWVVGMCPSCGLQSAWNGLKEILPHRPRHTRGRGCAGDSFHNFTKKYWLTMVSPMKCFELMRSGGVNMLNGLWGKCARHPVGEMCAERHDLLGSVSDFFTGNIRCRCEAYLSLAKYSSFLGSCPLVMRCVYCMHPANQGVRFLIFAGMEIYVAPRMYLNYSHALQETSLPFTRILRNRSSYFPTC
jgi:hypothetical protein